MNERDAALKAEYDKQKADSASNNLLWSVTTAFNAGYAVGYDAAKTNVQRPPSPAPSKKGTRVPDPFLITDDMRRYASEKRSDVDVTLETEKFVNYWQAKAGKDATKIDWPATWRNWILGANGGVAKVKSVTASVGKNTYVESDEYKCQDCFDTGLIDVPHPNPPFKGATVVAPCPDCEVKV